MKNAVAFLRDLGVPRIYTYPNGLKLKLTWEPKTLSYEELIFSLFTRIFFVGGKTRRTFDYLPGLLKRPVGLGKALRMNFLLLFDIKGYVIVKDSPRARKNELITIKSRYEFKFKELMKLATGDSDKKLNKRLELEKDILVKARKDLEKHIVDFDPDSVILFRFTSIVTDLSIKVVRRPGYKK